MLLQIHQRREDGELRNANGKRFRQLSPHGLKATGRRVEQSDQFAEFGVAAVDAIGLEERPSFRLPSNSCRARILLQAI